MHDCYKNVIGLLSDIYIAPFIPENPSGFTSYTPGSTHPALNANSLVNNVSCKTWK